MKLDRGFVHLYTGDGKGKTTCAVGLAIRALGAGLKVAFIQFFKPHTSSEVKILKKFAPQLLYLNFHTGGFVYSKPSPELVSIIKKGWQEVKKIASSGEFDLLILDELTYALNWNIISEEELIDFLKNKPQKLEIVITGRRAPQSLLSVVDLATEMKEIKHYFTQGVIAREGIEK